jgi:uncharacterized coiled-coil DUF342 family protein
MSENEKLKELLGEDVYNTHVAPKLDGKKIFVGEGEFIPKGRFDEINNQAKTYKASLEAKEQEVGSYSEKLKELEVLRKELAESGSKYQKTLLRQELSKTNTKDPDVLAKLVDMEKVKFENEKFTGLDEQLAEIKKNKPYLFNSSVDKFGNPIEPNKTKTDPTPDATQQKPWNKYRRM